MATPSSSSSSSSSSRTSLWYTIPLDLLHTPPSADSSHSVVGDDDSVQHFSDPFPFTQSDDLIAQPYVPPSSIPVPQSYFPLPPMTFSLYQFYVLPSPLPFRGSFFPAPLSTPYPTASVSTPAVDSVVADPASLSHSLPAPLFIPDSLPVEISTTTPSVFYSRPCHRSEKERLDLLLSTPIFDKTSTFLGFINALSHQLKELQFEGMIYFGGYEAANIFEGVNIPIESLKLRVYSPYHVLDPTLIHKIIQQTIIQLIEERPHYLEHGKTVHEDDYDEILGKYISKETSTSQYIHYKLKDIRITFLSPNLRIPCYISAERVEICVSPGPSQNTIRMFEGLEFCNDPDHFEGNILKIIQNQLNITDPWSIPSLIFKLTDAALRGFNTLRLMWNIAVDRVIEGEYGKDLEDFRVQLVHRLKLLSGADARSITIKRIFYSLNLFSNITDTKILKRIAHLWLEETEQLHLEEMRGFAQLIYEDPRLSTHILNVIKGFLFARMILSSNETEKPPEGKEEKRSLASEPSRRPSHQKLPFLREQYFILSTFIEDQQYYYVSPANQSPSELILNMFSSWIELERLAEPYGGIQLLSKALAALGIRKLPEKYLLPAVHERQKHAVLFEEMSILECLYLLKKNFECETNFAGLYLVLENYLEYAYSLSLLSKLAGRELIDFEKTIKPKDKTDEFVQLLKAYSAEDNKTERTKKDFEDFVHLSKELLDPTNKDYDTLRNIYNNLFVPVLENTLQVEVLNQLGLFDLALELFSYCSQRRIIDTVCVNRSIILFLKTLNQLKTGAPLKHANCLKNFAIVFIQNGYFNKPGLIFELIQRLCLTQRAENLLLAIQCFELYLTHPVDKGIYISNALRILALIFKEIEDKDIFPFNKKALDLFSQFCVTYPGIIYTPNMAKRGLLKTLQNIVERFQTPALLLENYKSLCATFWFMTQRRHPYPTFLKEMYQRLLSPFVSADSKIPPYAKPHKYVDAIALLSIYAMQQISGFKNKIFSNPHYRILLVEVACKLLITHQKLLFSQRNPYDIGQELFSEMINLPLAIREEIGSKLVDKMAQVLIKKRDSMQLILQMDDNFNIFSEQYRKFFVSQASSVELVQIAKRDFVQDYPEIVQDFLTWSCRDKGREKSVDILNLEDHFLSLSKNKAEGKEEKRLVAKVDKKEEAKPTSVEEMIKGVLISIEKVTDILIRDLASLSIRSTSSPDFDQECLLLLNFIHQLNQNLKQKKMKDVQASSSSATQMQEEQFQRLCAKPLQDLLVLLAKQPKVECLKLFHYLSKKSLIRRMIPLEIKREMALLYLNSSCQLEEIDFVPRSHLVKFVLQVGPLLTDQERLNDETIWKSIIKNLIWSLPHCSIIKLRSAKTMLERLYDATICAHNSDLWEEASESFVTSALKKKKSDRIELALSYIETIVAKSYDLFIGNTAVYCLEKIGERLPSSFNERYQSIIQSLIQSQTDLSEVNFNKLIFLLLKGRQTTPSEKAPEALGDNDKQVLLAFRHRFKLDGMQLYIESCEYLSQLARSLPLSETEPLIQFKLRLLKHGESLKYSPDFSIRLKEILIVTYANTGNGACLNHALDLIQNEHDLTYFDPKRLFVAIMMGFSKVEVERFSFDTSLQRKLLGFFNTIFTFKGSSLYFPLNTEIVSAFLKLFDTGEIQALLDREQRIFNSHFHTKRYVRFLNQLFDLIPKPGKDMAFHFQYFYEYLKLNRQMASLQIKFYIPEKFIEYHHSHHKLIKYAVTRGEDLTFLKTENDQFTQETACLSLAQINHFTQFFKSLTKKISLYDKRTQHDKHDRMHHFVSKWKEKALLRLNLINKMMPVYAKTVNVSELLHTLLVHISEAGLDITLSSSQEICQASLALHSSCKQLEVSFSAPIKRDLSYRLFYMTARSPHEGTLLQASKQLIEFLKNFGSIDLKDIDLHDGFFGFFFKKTVAHFFLTKNANPLLSLFNELDFFMTNPYFFSILTTRTHNLIPQILSSVLCSQMLVSHIRSKAAKGTENSRWLIFKSEMAKDIDHLRNATFKELSKRDLEFFEQVFNPLNYQQLEALTSTENVVSVIELVFKLMQFKTSFVKHLRNHPEVYPKESEDNTLIGVLLKSLIEMVNYKHPKRLEFER